MIPRPFRAGTPRPQPEPDEQDRAREWLESGWILCEKCGELVGDRDNRGGYHCGKRWP